ncbi:uncharacterized protein [Antedon mediterranea]|uniref:uncharacterized protein n=1 Tax=Antedon mediterranea TaxID=105859 RepID=UPI003AF78EBD
MRSIRNIFKRSVDNLDADIEKRPKLKTPETSDSEEDGSYDSPEEIFQFSNRTEDDLFPTLPTRPVFNSPYSPPPQLQTLPLVSPDFLQKTRVSLNHRTSETPVNRKKPLLPPKLKQPVCCKQDMRPPAIPTKPVGLPTNNKLVNVVTPIIQPPCSRRIERGLHKEIVYVHKQRMSGLNLLEISFNGKPPIPKKPGSRILIKKPPPLPIKPAMSSPNDNSSSSSIESSSDDESSIETVKTLSVTELAEEISKLNVEQKVVENVTKLMVDGALATKMSKSLISSSLECNRLDTLKIYQYIYHGWKPNV